MKIYIVELMPYHENNEILGVYTDRKEAWDFLTFPPDGDGEPVLSVWDTDTNECVFTAFYASKQHPFGDVNSGVDIGDTYTHIPRSGLGPDFKRHKISIKDIP